MTPIDLQAEAQRYEDLCEEIKEALDCRHLWAGLSLQEYFMNCYYSGRHHGQSLDAIADRWVEEQAAQRLEREKRETTE